MKVLLVYHGAKENLYKILLAGRQFEQQGVTVEYFFDANIESCLSPGGLRFKHAAQYKKRDLTSVFRALLKAACHADLIVEAGTSPLVPTIAEFYSLPHMRIPGAIVKSQCWTARYLNTIKQNHREKKVLKNINKFRIQYEMNKAECYHCYMKGRSNIWLLEPEGQKNLKIS